MGTSGVALATILALGSALLHATWNLAIKASDDRLAFASAQLLGAGGVGVVALFFVGLPPIESLPRSLASGALHAVNAVILAGAYRHGDLSLVYPLSRGLAPVFTALGAAILLGDTLGVRGYVGTAVVSLALLGMVGIREQGSVYGWGASAGVCVAAAVLNDATVVRGTSSALPHLSLVFISASGMLAGVVFARRGLRTTVFRLRESLGTGALTGVAIFSGYGLVLTALRHAPVAYVATLREVSIVFGTLGGWLILREPAGPRRLVGTIILIGGVGLLASSN